MDPFPFHFYFTIGNLQLVRLPIDFFSYVATLCCKLATFGFDFIYEDK